MKRKEDEEMVYSGEYLPSIKTKPVAEITAVTRANVKKMPTGKAAMTLNISRVRAKKGWLLRYWPILVVINRATWWRHNSARVHQKETFTQTHKSALLWDLLEDFSPRMSIFPTAAAPTCCCAASSHTWADWQPLSQLLKNISKHFSQIYSTKSEQF